MRSYSDRYKRVNVIKDILSRDVFFIANFYNGLMTTLR